MSKDCSMILKEIRRCKMEKSYSDSAKNVLEIAKEQAQNFHHRIIGTEHVLLALVIEANGDAGKLLRERNGKIYWLWLKSKSHIYGNVAAFKLSFKFC